MSTYKDISNFFFVGIGGIGMSALARFLNHQGKQVAGYDRENNTITTALKAEGILVQHDNNLSAIKNFKPHNTWVIYTPAVPESDFWLMYFKNNSFKAFKRATLLAEVTKQSNCLAVAGTHGKTTTSGILAHILMACKMPVTAFLGGILAPYNTNFLYQGDAITVVEADEFDRSFLKLQPTYACITTLDADHLDVYKTKESLVTAFQEFAELLPHESHLFFKAGAPLKGNEIGFDTDYEVTIEILGKQSGCSVFNLTVGSLKIPSLCAPLPGEHNLFNTVMAICLALQVGTPHLQIRDALQSFKGLARRFSIHIDTETCVLIDDYAHHPTELNALLEAVKTRYPNKPIQLVFQPHLYSRTRDFMEEFAASLSQCEAVVLLPIYPAREAAIPGVSSAVLLEKVNAPKKTFAKDKNAVLEAIQNTTTTITLVVGAGDIGAMVPEIKSVLENEE